MAWVTPKMNWAAADAVAATDMNRIEGNVDYLNTAKAAAVHVHSAADVTTGTLPIARGGTGTTTAAAVRNALGLGNTTAALPVANGGTGATNAAAALAAIGGATAFHSHAPTDINAGTLPVGVVATNDVDYTTPRPRNIQAGTSDLTAGVTGLANGSIYLVYE
jgi:hypothetical protein